MTISSTTRIAGPYIGNGTASFFSFTFKVFNASDLQVVRVDTTTGVETTLVLNTDYAVSLNADQDSNPGGSIVLTSGSLVLAVGFNMIITSDIANLQPTDLTNQGGFYPEVITDALDRATIQIQQMADELTRSIKIPVTDGLSLDMELPTAAARANSFLAFDATGEPTVVTAGSPGSPTSITRQQFSGTGAQVAYTLASDPGALGNSCEVFVGGIYQQRDTYTIAGTTLTFSAAPVAGTDNIEVVNFLTTAIGTTDSSLVTYVPAGAGATQRTVQAKLRDVVSVKDFGAIGDGVADDTAAFVAANAYLMTTPLPATNQVVGSQYITLYIPNGIYKISGHRIFGSQIPTGNNGTTPPRLFKILGQGATLIWDVQNENDELFYFDGTIENPHVSGLTIFTTHATYTAAGAGNIFRFYSNLSLSNQSNASKMRVENVSVWPGRRTSGGAIHRPKWVFYNTGNAMCDQVLIQHCRFYYIQKVWVGENTEAVNITFSSCSMWGASNGTATNTIYFDFTVINDNFNVVNCAFSVMSGETLIRTNCGTSGGFYVGSPGYNFNFDNNRIEFSSGTSNVSWKLCDMNFGKLNLRNTNLRCGGASSLIKTIVSIYQLANVNFENILFNATDFQFPVATAASFSGSLNSYGAYIKNCQLLPGTSTTYAYTDGVTNYDIKTVLASNTITQRSVRFQDCGFTNRNGLVSWSFGATSSTFTIDQRKHETITYSQTGVAFGKELLLPPYQVVKKITLNMAGTLPDTFTAFRVWIGDRTLSNTYDVDNIRPDIRKNDYTLFKGNATVFYTDQSLQSVEVALIDGGVENNTITSEISVEYAPMDARALGITTTSDQIKMFQSNSSVFSGTTAQRPNINLFINDQYFDTTLSKPIWWNGSVWKDATGTTV